MPQEAGGLFRRFSGASAVPGKVELLPEMGTQQRIGALMEAIDDEDIDRLIDSVTRQGDSPRSIIKRFHPQATWLWRQWQGTVLQQTFQPALAMMFFSAVLCSVMEVWRTWPVLGVPDDTDLVVRQLKGLNNMWGYLLTMAGFVNSFFLSQAYGFWLATKGNLRKVQGRLNDVGILLATHAHRDELGRFTTASRALLDDVSRWARLYHVLYWAGQVRPARGDEGASLSVLRTERGLERMLARGLLSKREHQLLVQKLVLPETQRHSVVLEWITCRIVMARRSGSLDGGAGFESLILEKLLLLRSVAASITDDAAARMPLAYVHLVQILVDVLVALAPFALYSRLGVFVIPLTGILTTFYRGFLVLSKSFLDPFGNEDSLSENFNLLCVVTETNAGSIRWRDGIEELPFDGHGEPTPPS